MLLIEGFLLLGPIGGLVEVCFLCIPLVFGFSLERIVELEVNNAL